ncbi:MAG: EutN/CcmL family microcompartment protein [Planctomycetes bacterium]|nr:EutN/CcmL family microcompartment protein [Planctomycetota bacterium]
MQRALVVGHAVATVKHPSLHGWKLLVAQPLTTDGKNDGEPLLVIDSLGAGVGDNIVISSDGAGTRQLIGHKNSPARWLNLGICDPCASPK